MRENASDRIILLTLSILSLAVGSAFAQSRDAPLRTEAPNATLFLGNWTGTWLNTKTQENGKIGLVVTQLVDNFLNLRVKLTNSKYPEWGATGEVKDGVLLVHEPMLRVELSLGPNRSRMAATFSYRENEGTWDLRKR